LIVFSKKTAFRVPHLKFFNTNYCITIENATFSRIEQPWLNTPIKKKKGLQLGMTEEIIGSPSFSVVDKIVIL
jgi:hypothetical protein